MGSGGYPIAQPSLFLFSAYLLYTSFLVVCAGLIGIVNMRAIFWGNAAVKILAGMSILLALAMVVLSQMYAVNNSQYPLSSLLTKLLEYSAQGSVTLAFIALVYSFKNVSLAIRSAVAALAAVTSFVLVIMRSQDSGQGGQLFLVLLITSAVSLLYVIKQNQVRRPNWTLKR